uniref:Uncharacterized protein n=1 Tax=candidate division WOR-3 bacterium TaxID=2052148 RepID=A0A7C4U859_UNCW3
MLFLILSEFNIGTYSSFSAGSFYETTPTGIQGELFLGKGLFFTNLSYYNYSSKSYILNICENGYGVYFNIIGLKAGLSYSYFYFYRKSQFEGFEDGFSSLFSIFLKKYFINGDKFISINLKMSEVFNEKGFDIYNMGISFGLQ